jgi:hypothetical protein
LTAFLAAAGFLAATFFAGAFTANFLAAAFLAPTGALAAALRAGALATTAAFLAGAGAAAAALVTAGAFLATAFGAAAGIATGATTAAAFTFDFTTLAMVFSPSNVRIISNTIKYEQFQRSCLWILNCARIFSRNEGEVLRKINKNKKVNGI